MLKKIQLKVTTTGAAGSATGSVTSVDPIMGRILRVDLNYHAAAPATTDVTLAMANEQVADNIVSVSNNATDKAIYPRKEVQDNADTDVTYDGTRKIYEPFVCADEVTVSVAQSDALTDCLVVEIYYEEI